MDLGHVHYHSKLSKRLDFLAIVEKQVFLGPVLSILEVVESIQKKVVNILSSKDHLHSLHISNAAKVCASISLDEAMSRITSHCFHHKINAPLVGNTLLRGPKG